MEEKFTGFVLSAFPLSASRFIVCAFTREGGKRRGVFRVTKKESQAYLAPLTCLTFHLTGKEHQELRRMSQIGLESHLFGLASNYLGLTLLQHWARLVESTQPEGQHDDRVFRLLDHALNFLRTEPGANASLANLYFEAWLLHFAGVLPRLSSRAQGPFDSVSGWEEKALEMADLAKLLEPAIAGRVFEQKIGEFAGDALKLGSPGPTQRVLGRMWELLLGKANPMRDQLMGLFGER